LQLGYLNTDSGSESDIFLTYQRRFGRWAGDVSMTGHKRKEADELIGRTTLNYDSKQLSGQGSRLKLSEEGGKQSGETGITHAAEYSRTSGHFDTDVFGTNRIASNDTHTAFGGTAKSSFVLTQSGDIAVAPAMNGESAFIAEIESDSTTSPVEIV